MAWTNDQVNSDRERDLINPQMRASAPWRNAIRAMGLNPDGPLKLSGSQRQSLARTMGLPNDVHIDQAGNINDFHGWKGLPTAAKVAIVTGAAVGTAGAAGAFGGGAAGASAASGGSMGGLYGASVPAITPMGVSSGVGAGAAAAGGSGMGYFSTLGKFFGSPGGAKAVDFSGNLIGDVMQNRSQNRAADIAGRYNTDALNFLKEQDARDYAEYLKERERDWRFQDQDRGYLAEDRTRGEEDRQLKLLREREREGRLAPFRQGAERGYQTLSSLLFNPNQQMARSAPVGNVQRRSLADLMVG